MSIPELKTTACELPHYFLFLRCLIKFNGASCFNFKPYNHRNRNDDDQHTSSYYIFERRLRLFGNNFVNRLDIIIGVWNGLVIVLATHRFNRHLLDNLQDYVQEREEVDRAVFTFCCWDQQTRASEHALFSDIVIIPIATS